MKIATINKWNGICNICGGPTSGERSLRCFTCYVKSRTGVPLSKSRTKEHQGKLNVAQIGKTASPEAKRKMSISHTGKIFGPVPDDRKRKISETLKRKYESGEIKVSPKARQKKRNWYNGIYFRSSWELKFAQWLNARNISWLYEPATFKLPGTGYIPDFYLPDKNLYIEIKGKEERMEKIQLFKKLYKVRIKILLQPDLIKLGVIK